MGSWRDRAIKVEDKTTPISSQPETTEPKKANSWRDRAVPVTKMGAIEAAYDIGEKGLTKGLELAEPVLNYMGRGSDAVYTAVMKGLKERTGIGKDIPFEDIVKALKGEGSPEGAMEAVVGKSETTPSDIFPSAYSETGEGFKLKKGGMFDPTYSQAMETTTKGIVDPLNVLLPGAAKAIKSAPGKIRSAVEATIYKPRTLTAVSEGGDVLKSLEQQKSALQLTPEQIKYNEMLKAKGYEPLSAAQQQIVPTGEASPAQMTEGLIKTRSPELFDTQTRQLDSARKKLERWQQLQASNPEVAGQKIKQELEAIKSAAGERIGEGRKLVADKSVFGKKEPISTNKPIESGVDLTYEYKRLSKPQQSIIGEFANEYKNAKTVDDLMALNTKMAEIVDITPEFNTPTFNNALKKVKGAGKNLIIKELEKAGIDNPAKFYEDFAITMDVFEGDLKGLNKLGKSKEVIDRVTRSGENFVSFKDKVTKLGKPELADYIRDNWLGEMANDTRFRSRFEKAIKEGVAEKILDKGQIKEIQDYFKYVDQVNSTSASKLNPSRSGLMNFITNRESGLTKNLFSYYFGDEAKWRKAIRRYNELNPINKRELTTTGKVLRGSLAPIRYPYRTGQTLNRLTNEED